MGGLICAQSCVGGGSPIMASLELTADIPAPVLADVCLSAFAQSKTPFPVVPVGKTKMWVRQGASNSGVAPGGPVPQSTSLGEISVEDQTSLAAIFPTNADGSYPVVAGHQVSFLQVVNNHFSTDAPPAIVNHLTWSGQLEMVFG